MGTWKRVPIVDWPPVLLDKPIFLHHSKAMGAFNTVIIVIACHSAQECNETYNRLSNVDKQEIIVQSHQNLDLNQELTIKPKNTKNY